MFAVRQAIESREVEEKKFAFGDTWVADMFLSEAAQARRKAEMESKLGITPEVKRYQEIKAGVIVSSVGVALMIFLAVFMQGIVLGAKVPADTAEILSRLWIAGVIPFFVGIALMINGIVVSKRLVEIAKRNLVTPDALPFNEPSSLRPADTSEFIPTDYSVTDHTTKHLKVVKDRE